MSTLREKARARHSKVASITLTDLRALFHLPLQTAAEQLGISETMVKRVSRKFGVKKWPYRQVHWIDAQIEALRLHTHDEHEPPTSPKQQALELLINARTFVLEAGTVPPDLVQKLDRGVKELARQESNSPRSWCSASETKFESDIQWEQTWGEECSQSTASQSPKRDSHGRCTSVSMCHDTENDYLFPNRVIVPEEDLWGQVLTDELLFNDPTTVLENVASYIFDSM